MTCYQRHLGWLFDALELPHDKAHRERMDTALKAVLGVAPETHCPEVWAAYKLVPENERDALVPEVAARLGGAAEA